MAFYQTPPELKVLGINPGSTDNDFILSAYLTAYANDVRLEISADIENFILLIKNQLEALAQACHRQEPSLTTFSPWGNRIDELKLIPEWRKLQELAAQEGLIAIGYERHLGHWSRLHQMIKLFYFHPSSAFVSCPLAMSDGAARTCERLLQSGPSSAPPQSLHTQNFLNEAFKNLTSRNPQQFWTSGQWMTERTGGSDVNQIETEAVINDSQEIELWGDKWFTSATKSEVAMVLAKFGGDQRPTLFGVQVFQNDGQLNHIEILRLKNKLGTKSMPTAELRLLGTPAVQLSEREKGVKGISELLNISRIYNSFCALGEAQRTLDLAQDYATKRMAFGRALSQHDIHNRHLAQLRAQLDGMKIWALHIASLMGRMETHSHPLNDDETRSLRLMIPILKLYTAKKAFHIVVEALDGFGGASYIEDTDLPRHLRDAQVFSIWEGTTHVLCLDVWRVIEKEQGLDFFWQHLAAMPSSAKYKAECLRAQQNSSAWLTSRAPENDLRYQVSRLAGLAIWGTSLKLENDLNKISKDSSELSAVKSVARYWEQSEGWSI